MLFLTCFARGQNQSYGDNVEKQCVPDESTFTSYANAFGQIYEVLNSKEVDGNNYENTAITLCNKQSRENFVATEWIINGEPPRSLFIQTGTKIIPQLHNSTIICSASDINKENWSPPMEAEFYRNVTGSITYKCQDFQIILTGLRLLKTDHSKLLRAVGSFTDKCVTYGNSSKGTDTKWLGRACDSEEYRYMFNETCAYGCFQCCENHYWSLEHKECEACGPCSYRKERNVWTKCLPEDECERSTTQPTPVLFNSTSKSTTSSSTTMPTTTSTTTYATSRGADHKPSSSTTEQHENQSSSISPSNSGPSTSAGIVVAFIVFILSACIASILSKKYLSRSPSGHLPVSLNEND
ncbi:uncharacterized protein LOC120339740 [Styela clava]